jgi:hypothetical protein
VRPMAPANRRSVGDNRQPSMSSDCTCASDDLTADVTF